MTSFLSVPVRHTPSTVRRTSTHRRRTSSIFYQVTLYLISVCRLIILVHTLKRKRSKWVDEQAILCVTLVLQEVESGESNGCGAELGAEPPLALLVCLVNRAAGPEFSQQDIVTVHTVFTACLGVRHH